MKKSRKKEVIKEALSKSQLFLAQFDLVIIEKYKNWLIILQSDIKH